MTEAQLQASVMDLSRQLGLYVYHTHDSRRSAKGFPDLVIVGNAVLFRELKGAALSARPTIEQHEVLTRLTEARADAGIWRPADWVSGLVASELMALRRRRHAPLT